MLIIALSGASCRSTAITTARETDNVRERVAEVGKILRDSIYLYRHDSIFVRIRGDTVFTDRWHTQYLYKERSDTLRQTDTLTMVRIEKETSTVEVNKLTWWQKTQIKTGWVLIFILLLTGIYKALKWRLKIKI